MSDETRPGVFGEGGAERLMRLHGELVPGDCDPCEGDGNAGPSPSAKNMVMLTNHGAALLYLHANQIQQSANYKLLSSLKSLTNLAIHGNPLDAVPNLEKKLLAALPNLTKLNFSPVTRLQRADAEQWKASQSRARAKLAK